MALKAARNVLAALPVSAEDASSAEQLEMFAPVSRVPRVFELLEQQRPRPDKIHEDVGDEAASGKTSNIIDITDEDEPSAYPIS